MLLALALACTGEEPAEETETPTVTFVSPADGDVVPAGDVDVTVIVEHFLLESPAKHNEGEPEGYLVLTVTQGDSTDTIETGATNNTVTLAAGEATLGADLYFADGDEIVEEFPDFVPAEISITVE
jgi:hypothetical protein